jgi:hypothetical protein
MRHFIFSLLIFFSSSLSAVSSLNPTPYLLPSDSPLKPTLDSIFSVPYVIRDKLHFEAAGFKTIFLRSRGLLRVAKHPELPGYLFKLYLEDDLVKKRHPIDRLVQRCITARKVREVIEKYHGKHIVVADKWIYKLPKAAKAAPGMYLLVVKDMQLVERAKSIQAWKAVKSHSVLKELYHILNAGYGSLAIDQNIPYTKTGTFAVIDTEYPKRQFNLQRVNRFLNTKAKKQWRNLTKEGR